MKAFSPSVFTALALVFVLAACSTPEDLTSIPTLEPQFGSADDDIGITLIVWRLDRLGRSLSHLISVTTGLEDRGVSFKSLQEGIDTTTPGGKLVFHIFGVLAEFERSLIRERTQAGLKAARARGRNGGRPKALTNYQLQMAQQMLAASDTTVTQVAESLGVSRSTLHRALKHKS